jgi:hypothetical protein
VSASQAAVRARTRAESLMTSTCSVYASGASSTDQNTGIVTRTPTAIWTGPCRVRPASVGLRTMTTEIADSESFRFDYRISVPYSVTAILEGHMVTVNSSPDPALVGTTYEIHKVDRGDNVTARRLICQRVT